MIETHLSTLRKYCRANNYLLCFDEEFTKDWGFLLTMKVGDPNDTRFQVSVKNSISPMMMRHPDMSQEFIFQEIREVQAAQLTHAIWGWKNKKDA